MPMTATLASCVLIFSSNVGMKRLPPALSWGFLVGQLALQDPVRVVLQQPPDPGGADPPLQPLDTTSRGARVIGVVAVAGAGVGEAFTYQPLRRLLSPRSVRPHERAEIDHQRSGPPDGGDALGLAAQTVIALRMGQHRQLSPRA